MSVFIEPLGGPKSPVTALDRFPDSIYNKSPETHFVRFMYSLLGPAGVGFIKKEYLEAKLAIYAQGFNTFSIEKYYGDPFSFGFILEEELPEDPRGMLTREQWELIKVRDESYRSRAITFFNGARAGGTPEGLKLAAESGLNHPAFVVENYKYLFDQHSDEPLGLPYYGQTTATEEFIVIPRQDISRSEQQIISFAEATATEGSFRLSYNGENTESLDYTANQFEVEAALTSLTQIGKEGVKVTGGPNPNPFIITFTGPLSNQEVPTIGVISRLLNNLEEPVPMYVRVLVGGVAPTEEVVVLSDEYQHNAQTAIDFLKPLGSLPTPYSGKGIRTQHTFRVIHSSSSYTEGIKFITGSESIKWPEVDSVNWIEAGKENESKRIEGDLQAHYNAYHTVASATSYTGKALEDPEYQSNREVVSHYKSAHVGRYDPRVTANFPFLAEQVDDSFVYSAARALPACAIPMEVTATFEEETLQPIIEDIVWSTSLSENSTGTIGIETQNWWSSLERQAPESEVLEIDLGSARFVNWITFEITRKPCYIELDYDRLDISPGTQAIPRDFVPVTPWAGYFPSEELPAEDIAGIAYNSSQPPWQQTKIFFRDSQQHNICTRFLRLIFKRPTGEESSPFVDPITKGQVPYSIDVRNLRVGRYAGASPTWRSV